MTGQERKPLSGSVHALRGFRGRGRHGAERALGGAWVSLIEVVIRPTRNLFLGRLLPMKGA